MSKILKGSKKDDVKKEKVEEVPVVDTKPKEYTREEYSKWLEKSGYLEKIMRVMVELYENPPVPEKADQRMKELLAAHLNLQDTGFDSVTDLKIAVEHLKDDNLRLIRKIKDLEEEFENVRPMDDA